MSFLSLYINLFVHPYLAKWLVAAIPVPPIQGGRHLIHILAGWSCCLTWCWTYRRWHLIDLFTRLSLTLSWGLAGWSWLGLCRSSTWTGGNLVHTLEAWFGTVWGGHHVDRVRVGLCRARGGVGWVHGCVLSRREGLVCKPGGRHWGNGWQGRCRFGICTRRVEGFLDLRGGTGNSWIWCGRDGLLLFTVVHANQDLETVARDNALAAVEWAEPPAIQSLCVTLQDCHNVALAERELIRRLCHIVIQRLGQNVLEKRET